MAPVAESTVDGVRVIRFDVGNFDLTDRPGQFVAPLRGSLVLPTSPGPHPLVVVNHLRSFGCTAEAFAYPCPNGSDEIRLDQGMEYLGVALAQKGRVVLLPDPSPTLLAATSTSDYPMGAAVVKVVTALRDRVTGEVASGSIAAAPAALITHSRSGLFASDLIEAWQGSTTPITSLLAVAPAYDLGTTWTPAPRDVSYLGLYGSLDDDVPFMAATYLTHHLGQSRTTAALAVKAPGYGHMFFNRALRGDDDRKSCEQGGCATAEQHEALLTKAALSWIDAAGPGGDGDAVPRTATSELPTTLWGESVAMVAITPHEHLSLLAGSDAEAAAAVVQGGVSHICRMIDPANPQPPADKCPEPQAASVMTQDIPLRFVTLEPGGALTYQLPASTGRVGAVALHVSPFEEQPDGHPLRITVRDAKAATCSIDLAGNHPVLANGAGDGANMTYVVGTIRTPVCANVDAAHLTSISLGTPSGKAQFLVLGIDVIPAADQSGSPAPSTATGTPTPTPSAQPEGLQGPWLWGRSPRHGSRGWGRPHRAAEQVFKALGEGQFRGANPYC